MAVALFADRFLLADEERAFDLATGADVTLRFPVLDRPAHLHAWLRRCAALLSLEAPALVPLLDFGLSGRDRHFEALGCPRGCPAWERRDAGTARALLKLAAFLHARGLSLGSVQAGDLVELRGQVALVPGRTLGRALADVSSESGSEGTDAHDDVAEHEIAALWSFVSPWGVGEARPAHGPRRAAGDAPVVAELLRQLAEVLDGGVSGRPRSVELAIPAGVEATTALRLVARESRLHGYVPVNPSVLRALPPARLVPPSSVQALLHGRHVLVLHDGRPIGRARASSLFVALGLDSDRPHVLLGLTRPQQRERSLWLLRAAAPTPEGGESVAREEPAVYGRPVAVRPPGASFPPDADQARWSFHRSSSNRPRARLAQALDIAFRGRHASAMRALRQTLGMLSRREDLPGAGETALALGCVLLTRGQVREAAEAFENARRLFDRSALLAHSVVSALFVGLAWTDAGRWLEAEAAIRAALIAAEAMGGVEHAVFGRLALARCLFWQGRLKDAADALPPETSVQPAVVQVARVAESAELFQTALARAEPRLDPLVARGCLAARISIATEDLRAAGTAAASARERATTVGHPTDTAAACTAMAAVYAALGDAPAVRLHVDEGLRAARLAHAPLRAIRLRTVLAEGLLRSGKSADARPLLARLARLDVDALPVVVARPVRRVLEWKSAAAPTGVGRIAPEPDRRAGTALATAGTGRLASPDVVETVIELLGFCQSIEDDETLARKAVSLLRARVRATTTTCFGFTDQQVVPVAADGRELAPAEIALRAAETGLVIAPGATGSGLEAAVPVRLGGRVIGALACRWPADVPPEWPASGAVLAASAAALAPCLRAVLDRRAVPAVPTDPSPEQMVGISHAARALQEEIDRAARAPFNVVVEGESGSGKELVARAIHRLGPRRHRRLCAINCAALTDELLEAELFGHARGAFTGAVAERKGLFEEADGGTLVLDEVGELTPRAQAKLLRAIQEGEVRRLGENFPRAVDARIIAASNRALRSAVEAGSFRRDLLYRLEVIRIVVPPLRERVDDIPLLAAHFWRQATGRLGSRATLAPSTLAALARYDWPGNVRELQNVMAALAVAAGRRGSIGPDRLPSIIAGDPSAVRGATLDEARRVFESRFVRAALARAGGRRAQAARDLGLTRQGLAKLLGRLGIDPGGGETRSDAGGY